MIAVNVTGIIGTGGSGMVKGIVLKAEETAELIGDLSMLVQLIDEDEHGVKERLSELRRVYGDLSGKET